MKKLLLLICVAVLSACSSSSPDVIQRGDAQRLSTVQDAVVLSVRAVTVEGSQSGAGAATGGVVGGIAGYGTGGSKEAQVVGVLGAVVGAVAGNAIERASTREDAYEILVQLKNGDRRAVVQAKGGDVFETGDPVVLITSSGKVRVVKVPK